MFVGNPVFPISFKLEQVAGLVEETLLKKNWRSFEKGEIKLVLTPFYLFYYDAGFEEEGKLKEKTEHGKLALNAETAELNKELADTMPDESELVKELPDNYPLIVRKPIFSKHEAKKIALLKTASLVGTDRQNLVLSSFRMVYYPMWIAFVTIAEETKQLEISAVTGEVFVEEQVPSREKGFVEITKETLRELKKPDAWLQYSKEIGEIATGKLAAGGEEKAAVSVPSAISVPSIRKRPWLWLTVVLIIILIALMVLWP